MELGESLNDNWYHPCTRELGKGALVPASPSAGERDEEDNFPEGSFNRKVRDRLIELAEKRRRCSAETAEDSR